MDKDMRDTLFAMIVYGVLGFASFYEAYDASKLYKDFKKKGCMVRAEIIGVRPISDQLYQVWVTCIHPEETEPATYILTTYPRAGRRYEHQREVMLCFVSRIKPPLLPEVMRRKTKDRVLGLVAGAMCTVFALGAALAIADRFFDGRVGEFLRSFLY